MKHTIEQDIRDWSKYVLEIPNEHLNGLPACPYAKKAWMDNKVCVMEVEDIIVHAIKHRKKVLEDFDLLITASYNIPDSTQLNKTIDALNVLCANENIYFMCFHPDYGAEDAELDFLYDTDWESSIEEEYAMVFVQRLTDVDDKSRHLEKLGYYQAFGKDDYKSLVLKRREMRNAHHGHETTCNEQD